MKKLMAVVIAAMVLAWAAPAWACTGFAVYSEQPIYGMNFDYAETELKLSITQNRCQKHFSLEFKEGNRFQPTVGMNDIGLFTSIQMQFPEQTGASRHGADELFIHELFGCIRSCVSVGGVLDFVGDKHLVHWSGITLHALLADPAGNALIAEAGEEQNEFVTMEDDFIVMTNFKHSDFRDTPYDRVSGVGDDRYIAAHEYISENTEAFGIEQAFETLRLTAQEGRSPTLSSMVFVPGEQSVYIALHRNFDQVWKISILYETIETYRGFDTDMKYHIPKDGVLASDLLNGDFSAYEVYAEGKADEMPGQSWYVSPLAIVVALAAVVAIGILVRKRRKEA